MKLLSVAIALTAINLILMIILLGKMRPAHAQQQQQNIQPVLRARSLEIVDSLGKVRASITIQPPVVVDGRKYPQTVLLRLIDKNGKPLVKLGAAEGGSALSLIDDNDRGFLVHVHDTSSFVKFTNKGKERVIKP